MKGVLLDLFAGGGGFSLAAHWAGMKTAAFVEFEKFPQMVLKKNFPGVPIWSDIRDFNKIEFDNYYKQINEKPPKINIITGGFPCQPFSAAGKRNGANDNRYLWPEMLRIIEEFKPSWVIGENVAGILSMVKPDGKIEMEGKTASLFKEDSQVYTEECKFITESICQDFERIGYKVQPIVIPACAIGAIHRRDRVWFIANACQIQRNEEREKEQFFQSGKRRSSFSKLNGSGFQEVATNSKCIGQQGQRRPSKPVSKKKNREREADKFINEFLRTTKPPVCGADDGVSIELDGYKLTRNRHREERLKLLGNAIVPQVAYHIFKGINEVSL